MCAFKDSHVGKPVAENDGKQREREFTRAIVQPFRRYSGTQKDPVHGSWRGSSTADKDTKIGNH